MCCKRSRTLRATLKSNAGPDVKAVALCWIMHDVGDIHQPLHSTALFSVDQFPQGDKGGNSIPLVHGRNLHSVWDGLLGRDSRMRNVTKIADELSDKDRFGDEWKTAGQEMDPIKWADESHAACASIVYSEAILDAVRGTPAGEKLQPIDLEREYYTRAGEERGSGSWQRGCGWGRC